MNRSFVSKFFRSAVTAVVLVVLLSGCGTHMQGMFAAKGFVAAQQRTLFLDSVALMLVVVIPVIILSIDFAIRYRASQHEGRYQPDFNHSTFLETIWWSIPTVIVIVLSVMVWHYSHTLDPYQPLKKGAKNPLTVQVVALRWKWLFIYPKAGIATVNYLEIPAGRQVQFLITADAPMSAFDIPSLGGQIYAMAGMTTKLHLYSDHPGVYEGLNTQLNGVGFSHMHFKAYVVDQAKFQKWILGVQRSGAKTLNVATYGPLFKPTIVDKPKFYAHTTPYLFKHILQQYMMPNHWLHESLNQPSGK